MSSPLMPRLKTRFAFIITHFVVPQQASHVVLFGTFTCGVACNYIGVSRLDLW